MVSLHPERLAGLALFAFTGIASATPQACPQDTKLVGSQTTVDGSAVAISGSRALVGSNVIGNGPGRAYLFDVQTGAQLIEFVGDDENNGDRFGVSVALDGPFALIGAPKIVAGGGAGSVHVFDAVTGVEQHVLVPEETLTGSFGGGVAISGTLAIITGSRMAFVFDVTTGEQLQTISAPNVNAQSSFGTSIALSGTTAIIGAQSDLTAGVPTGSAFLYDVITGAKLFKLTPSDGNPLGFFGNSVAIDGDRVIVGAPGETPSGVMSGAAYLFDVSTGTQLARLLPDVGQPSTRFGESVAIDGGNAVVGAAYQDLVFPDSGQAYAFDVATGAQVGEFAAADTKQGILVGLSAAMDGTKVVLGPRAGATAYVFDMENCVPTPGPVSFCTAKLNSGGIEPAIGWSGVTEAEGTLVLTTNHGLASKPGLVFHGQAPIAVPFFGGTLCAAPPLQRGPVVLSDPTGQMQSSDFLTFADVGKTRVYQWWYRDPQHPDGTGVGLSDALETTVAIP